MDKTCVTCQHCVTAYNGNNSFCRKKTLLISLARFDVAGVQTPFGGVCYQERTDSVEQMALDLLAAIKAMHNPCNEDRCCSLADYGWPEGVCAYDFERRLEALEVEA